MNRIHKICMAVFLFSVLLLAGCATIASYKITQEKDWLEGKPFPVSITFTYNEKVERCTLYYSVNRGEIHEIPLKLFGTEYGYIIPGEQLVEGELHYYFTAAGKDEEYTSTTYRVTILTYRQAREKYSRELSGRISFHPPKAVPYFDDAVLSLIVNKRKPDTEVIVHFKKKYDTEYKTRPLNSLIGGIFQGAISNEEIQDGYSDYYFTVTENHPDIGLLTVHVPGAAESAPYSLSILDKSDLYTIMKEEMRESISFIPPETVPETKDLVVHITVKYPAGSYMEKYEKNRREVIINYGIQGFENTFVPARMTGEDNKFYYTIKKEELEKGYNAFYFDIQDTLDHIGIVKVTCPENGAGKPFAYRIKTMEELVAEKKADVYIRISHSPPEKVDGISDLILTLDFIEITEKTEVELHYKQSRKTYFNHRQMNKTGNSFRGIITARELQDDYNQYYFTITVYDDLAGVLVLDHPSQGERNCYSFHIEDKEDVYQRLKKNLRDRITFIPVMEVARGSSLVLHVTIDEPVDKTEVLIYYGRKKDKMYNKIYMTGTGNKFSGEIPEYELRKKYDTYYIEVREPHDFFDYISVQFPHAGPGKPYEVKIISGEPDKEAP
ncbi:MAG: hypothetical protein JXB88_15800 [Spirochaetales bacterium]|nr:hypothetical protein [Spirochaetales bacterium]